MKKKLLYVRPARAPRWWPRNKRGRAEWVGVLGEGSGWVVGRGTPMGPSEMRVARAAVSYDIARPRFRTEGA